MNRHHVLFERAIWEKEPYSKKLRRESGLIIPMDEEVHAELHRDVGKVPLLGRQAITLVHNEFYRGNNHMETIDNLLFAFNKVEIDRKMPPEDRRLAELAIHNVGLQKPYIKFGTERE